MADRWSAPAKLNLFLHVLGRRGDGYHELQTLFQLLDWGDAVRIRILDHPTIRRSRAAYGVPEAEDLAVRAAKLLQAEAGCSLGAHIEVIKRIPLGAGLGGGSSNAATVLAVLNREWNCGLTVTELARLGLRLGADIPVFVHGHSALATGVGDELEPVRLGKRHYLLVFAPFSVSTAALFEDPDLPRNTPPISVEEALAGGGINAFEPLLRRRYPDFDRMFEALRSWGRPRMTGTGSTIFVTMADRASARRAAEQMKSLYNVRAVEGVDRSPLQDELEAAAGQGRNGV